MFGGVDTNHVLIGAVVALAVYGVVVPYVSPLEVRHVVLFAIALL